MLHIKDLSYSYKGKPALLRLNLLCKEAMLIGLFGHNGSGKSTLLKILSGLLPCNFGEVQFFGQNALDNRALIKKSFRHSMGVLFQGTSSDAMLTVQDNIRYFSMMMGIDTKKAPLIIEDTIKLANLYDEREHRVKTLSHGMRRRLELYRTFMHKPKLVFLDEPTAGLDVGESARFLKFVSEYQKQEGALVLFATHHPHELELCDEVIMVSKGTVIAHEKPETLNEELDHWRYEIELDQKGEIRALAFMRADLSEVYEERHKDHHGA